MSIYLESNPVFIGILPRAFFEWLLFHRRMDNTRRRQVLRLGGVALASGLAGCSGDFSFGGGSGGGNDVQDTDGDGVIDSEDYAPRDPDVQREEQVKGDTSTETEETTDLESSSKNIFDDFEDSQLGWTVADGDGSALTFVSESIHGSQSLYFENSPNDIKLEKQFNQPVQPSEFSLWFKYRSQRDNNFRYYLRDQNGNTLIEIREFSQTVHYKNRGGSGVTSEPIANINMEKWYQVAFSNIDFESQTLDITVTDSSDNVVNSVTNINFRDTVEQVNDVRLINSLEAQNGPGGATDPLWIDHITYSE